MSTTQIVWIIVIVVVAIALVALAANVVRRRSVGHRRGRAESIRTDASARLGDVRQSRHDAERAEAEAQRLRAEAEAAEANAAEARRGAAQEQAAYEDRLREADRLDPDVDHTSVDYSGDPPPTRPNA